MIVQQNVINAVRSLSFILLVPVMLLVVAWADWNTRKAQRKHHAGRLR